MENASKALIIAGAILLSILIIALGMFILNKATSSADVSTALTENEIQAFNKKFENYSGEQLGSNVISLISVARSAKSASKDTGVNANLSLKITPVNINGLTTSAETVTTYSTISNKIERSHTYYITFEYGEDGRVNEIKVDYNLP